MGHAINDILSGFSLYISGITIIALVLDVPTLRIRAISALQLPDRPEPCAWSCDPLQVAVGPTGDHLVEVALIEPPFRIAARRIVKRSHDAIRRNNIRALGNNVLIGLELGGNVGLRMI